MSHSRTDIARSIAAEVAHWAGAEVTFHQRRRGHPYALVCYGDESRKVTLPGTTANWRARYYGVRDTTAALRNLGATRNEAERVCLERRKAQPARRFEPRMNGEGIPLWALDDETPCPLNTIMAERLKDALGELI